MSEWRATALAELGSFSSGKPIVPGRPGVYKAYGSNGVIGGSPESRHDRGIIIGRVGAYCGSVAVSHEPFWASDNTIVLKPSIASDLDYLYFLLRSANLNRHAGGSAQPLVTQSTLKALRFSVPEPFIRSQIGRVLADFDRLIENNRRRVGVLEEMARAIYREWFVRFRYPGHESVPLVDSALGPIPGGWTVMDVASLSSEVTRGLAPKYADDGQSTVLNQKCIRDERVSFRPARQQERPIPAAKLVRRGDVLINSTGVGTLGRVAMYRASLDDVTVDTHVTIARPKDTHLNPWYGVSLVAAQPTFERLGTGSTGQTELGRGDIGALLMARPTKEVLAAYAAAVWPALDKADSLLAGAESLERMRDLLLPKLVTGQIDVSGLDLDALVADPSTRFVRAATGASA